MNLMIRIGLGWIGTALALPAAAQVIANSSFEGGSLAGWTVGGTNRVDAIQASHVSGTIPGGVPDGQWFAVLSTTPSTASCGGLFQPACTPTALIDANTTPEADIASPSAFRSGQRHWSSTGPSRAVSRISRANTTICSM